MNKVVTIILLLTAPLLAKSQSLYVETFGNTANFYSINYEHPLKIESNRYQWSLHGGFGVYKRQGYLVKTIPAGITWFNRKAGNHHTEFGLSMTYSESVLNHYVNGIMTSSEYRKHEFLYVIFNVGYRYQKPDGRFLFKIYWGPGFPLKEFTQPTPEKKLFYVKNLGISLGYRFKNRS